MEIGVDIVKISYVKSMVKKHGNRFIKRILSGEEQQIYYRKRRKYEFLAGRFAAKEAVYKATNHAFAANKVSVLNDQSGRPYVVFADGGPDVNISISHHGNYAVATAIMKESV